MMKLPFDPSQLLTRFAEALERRRLLFLAGFSILYLLGTAGYSSARLLWHDELITFYVARLPRLIDVWRALADAADVHPPLSFALSHVILAHLWDDPAAVRIPSMLGYWVLSLCLFWFVARSCPTPYAFAAMLAPVFSAAYDYAYEGRPYGLLLGFAGLALVSWQEAATGSRRRLALVGLAVGMAGAVSTHYYAVLIALAIGLGELARSARSQRLDWPVWGALVAGVAAVVAHAPLALAAKAYYGATQWSQLVPSNIITTYNVFFIPAIAVIILSLAALVLLRPREGAPVDESGGPPVHEITAALGLAAIPIFAFNLGHLFTNTYAPRYTIPAILGVVLLAVFTLRRVATGDVRVGAAVAMVLWGAFALQQISASLFLLSRPPSLPEALELLAATGGTGQTVVIEDPMLYFEAEHYFPEELASRFRFLTDLEAAQRLEGSDSPSRAYLKLRRYAPLTISDYGTYLAGAGEFLLYRRADQRPTWLSEKLLEDGAQLRLIHVHGNEMLYSVLPPNSARAARSSETPAGR